jgi:ligand-binding sensor domain-containing protein
MNNGLSETASAQQMRSRREPRCAHVVGLLVLTMIAAPARAERLPIRIYTTTDGLASSVILDILADSRGFLWFATRNGLSRFDGSEFRTYTTDDGLPIPVVNAVLETSTGEYLIATNGGGVCRFNGEQSGAGRGSNVPLFTCYSVGEQFLSNRVNSLYEDRRGRVWLATDNGLLW